MPLDACKSLVDQVGGKWVLETLGISKPSSAPHVFAPLKNLIINLFLMQTFHFHPHQTCPHMPPASCKRPGYQLDPDQQAGQLKHSSGAPFPSMGSLQLSCGAAAGSWHSCAGLQNAPGPHAESRGRCRCDVRHVLGAGACMQHDSTPHTANFTPYHTLP